jgi:hypothetical protein
MRGITAPAVFSARSDGQAERMDDEQHEPRTTSSSPEVSADESRDGATTAATVARMLANPRRVRRS